jgi:membrane associated rhomboid family serine protease
LACLDAVIINGLLTKENEAWCFFFNNLFENFCRCEGLYHFICGDQDGSIPLPVNAGIAILAWFGFQIFHVVVMTDDNTAWYAHIGGFIAGLVLVVLMRRKGVPLLDWS